MVCWTRICITQRREKIDKMDIARVHRTKLNHVEEGGFSICVKGGKSFEMPSDPYIEKWDKLINGLG